MATDETCERCGALIGFTGVCTSCAYADPIDVIDPLLPEVELCPTCQGVIDPKTYYCPTCDSDDS